MTRPTESWSRTSATRKALSATLSMTRSRTQAGQPPFSNSGHSGARTSGEHATKGSRAYRLSALSCRNGSSRDEAYGNTADHPFLAAVPASSCGHVAPGLFRNR